MVLSKAIRRLQTIYYTPSHPAGFTGNVKSLDSKKQKKTVKWLHQQDVYTKHRSLRRRYRRRRVIVLGKNHTWGVDLMDMTQIKTQNNGYAYVLIVIDLFSKKIDLRPLKQKTPQHVIAAFDDMIQNGPVWNQEPPPAFLQSDSGTEFSRSFQNHLLSKYRIKHYHLLNPDIKSSITERAIRTIKSRLYRYFTHKETKRYIDVLPDLVRSYNARFHSSIGMAPNQVTFQNQGQVRFNLFGTRSIDPLLRGEVYQQLSANRRLQKSTLEYQIGDKVRISKYKNVFAQKHGYNPNFTNEIFVIQSRDPPYIKNQSPSIRVLYRLRDLNNEPIAGRFYAEELIQVY